MHAAPRQITQRARSAVRNPSSIHRESGEHLNESTDFAPRLSDSYQLSGRSFVRDLIARKRFSKYGDERTIARKKDAIKVVVHVAMLSSDIETHERLAGSGYSCYEANRFEIPGLGLANHVGNRVRCHRKVGRRCVTPRNLVYGVPLIQGQRGFDDRWRGAVAPAFPFNRIDVRFTVSQRQDLVNDRADRVNAAVNWEKKPVIVWHFENWRRNVFRPARAQNWRDQTRMTGFVKILEIEGMSQT